MTRYSILLGLCLLAGLCACARDALRKARETSNFKDKHALWVKLIIADADFQGPVVEPVGRLVAQTTITATR